MKFLKKALLDNAFKLQEGIGGECYVFENTNIQIIVSIDQNHFKAFDNDQKEIAEGSLIDLPIDFEHMTRREFLYPVKQALIEMEMPQ